MRKALLTFAMIGLGCGQIRPVATVEWEHGWKTDRVVATRYQNKTMGYNIGFTFPKDPSNSDRDEISDFIDSHNGSIYQGGGFPGHGVGGSEFPAEDLEADELVRGQDQRRLRAEDRLVVSVHQARSGQESSEKSDLRELLWNRATHGWAPGGSN